MLKIKDYSSNGTGVNLEVDGRTIMSPLVKMVHTFIAPGSVVALPLRCRLPSKTMFFTVDVQQLAQVGQTNTATMVVDDQQQALGVQSTPGEV